MSKRKSPSTHQPDSSLRLKKIIPLTAAQKDVFQAYGEGKHLFLHGSAGTGKTFIALALALKDVLAGTTLYKKIIVVRSSVPSRDIGFLPGSLEDKIAIYSLPYRTMLNELFGRGDGWEMTSRKGLLEIVSTSFLRGMTFSNCILIFDEVQNATYEEGKTVITRVGENCRVILSGDERQCDLYRSRSDVSGIRCLTEIVKRMPSFHLVEFGVKDVVRSGVCREFLLAEMELGS